MKSDSFVCPIPLRRYPHIVAAHGGGGQLMHDLIEEMLAPVLNTPLLQTQTDSALLPPLSGRLVMTTDSYVVQPIEFPGGDIGKLAVCGTVNDLAMSGATPRYLTLGLILEEGLPLETLHRLLVSIRDTADEAGVMVVTGDTKVFSHPGSHGLLINTSGVGEVAESVDWHPSKIMEGDVLLVNGDIGRHGLAVMMKREGLEFESTLKSDVALLSGAVAALQEAGVKVKAMRDLTRGGLATALVEMGEVSGLTLAVEEEKLPVCEAVEGACELLGLDPLYAACEGRFVAVIAAEDAEKALTLLKGRSDCPEPVLIGRCEGERGVPLLLKTTFGVERILHRQSGEQMPRIC